MSESFEKEFTTLRELGTDIFVLRGSSIIVEIQEKEEIKIKGTNIVLESSKDHLRNSVDANRVQVGKVLMTGPGYWTDTPVTSDGRPISTHYLADGGMYEPLEVKTGAIVLMPQHSFSTISHFPGISRATKDKLAIIKMDAIIAYYPSVEAYELAKSKLNG